MSMQMEVGHEAGYNDRVGSNLPTTLSLNGNSNALQSGIVSESRSFENGIFTPSPETSGASTPLNESLVENGFSSCEEDGPYEDDEKIDKFVKEYVGCLFDPDCDISYENKAKFGELMKDAGARMSFAKYVDAYRNQVKCVDESTFYKLLHSFALVLFECGEADDYLPGKSLMNMAFTYYYIPDQRQVSADALSSQESVSSSSTTSSVDGHVTKRSKSDSDGYDGSKKRTLMQRFRKEVEACKQVFHDTPSFQELKQGFWRRPKHEGAETKRSEQKFSRSLSHGSATSHPDMCSPAVKNFLYEHLKNQVIWKSLRFWNAAFFSAVHAERKRRCIQKDWTALSADEQDSTNDAIVNITFGQLGTFINNMKCLGLDNKTCYEFLRKQSIIGGIEEGGQYYEMLIEQIEDDTTF
uniref:uncharacterized protein KIAA0513-like n=1 Tax=Styela clava TaxID=7725 RepID=UPI00193A214E|nr:uncharacterized protein KIAA0513-like [Styela clava]